MSIASPQAYQPNQANTNNQTTTAQSNANPNVIQRGDGLQVVVGLGGSGLSVVNYLTTQGYRVAVTDGGEPKLASALPADVITRFPGLDAELLASASRIIMSPGIDPYLPVFDAARAKNIPMVSDIQLFHEVCAQRQIPIVAITGSNAKSTVTTLVGEMAKDAGLAVGVGGNLGTPALDLLAEPMQLAVLELSSFQLQTTSNLSAQVATVLNMSPDHLDRHGTVEVYAQTKESIGKNQTKDQVMVLNYEDDTTRAMADRANGTVLFFSLHHKIKEGVSMEGDAFIIEENGKKQIVCTLDDVNLLGDHNYENILAAIAVTYSMGVPVSYIKEGIKRFKGVEHRIEYVAEKNGVVYYNDSKGTNPDAAIKGIQAMNRPTVLIGGGYDKDSAYDEWIDSFDGKVKKLVLLGATRDKIAETARAHGFEDIEMADTFEEAFAKCVENAKPGDAVLLSPACASWGMFKNYEERGNKFKELVNNL